MPHYRQRILERLLKKSISGAPIVGVAGARQTGKTTLLKRFAKKNLTFDAPKTEELFRLQGLDALQGVPTPLLLDEVQKYPPIFDLLKLAVDEERRPGRFLITGSVRFSSKKEVRESLTGRSQIWDILPLTLQECHEAIFDDIPEILIKTSASPQKTLEHLEKRAWARERDLLQYLEQGGMPGVCFLRDPAQRHLQIESYLETSLLRDLPMIYPNKLRYSQAIEVFRALLKNQGEPTNLSALARKISTSVPTVKSLLLGLEGIYLIRRNGRTYYGEDLAFTPSGEHSRPVLRFTHSVTRSWVSYLKDRQWVLDEHFTRNGSFVPFVLNGRRGETIAICTEEDDGASEKSIKSLYSLQKKQDNAVLLVLHRGERAYVHKNRILVIPWNWVV